MRTDEKRSIIRPDVSPRSTRRILLWIVSPTFLAFALHLAPAAGAVVRNNLLEHGGEGWGVDRFALTDGHRARGLVVVPSGDNSFGIGHNGAVVEKYVDVVLGRQQGADVALKHEVGTVGALDGFAHVWVGGVDQLANLAADLLLPNG